MKRLVDGRIWRDESFLPEQNGQSGRCRSNEFNRIRILFFGFP